MKTDHTDYCVLSRRWQKNVQKNVLAKNNKCQLITKIDKKRKQTNTEEYSDDDSDEDYNENSDDEDSDEDDTNEECQEKNDDENEEDSDEEHEEKHDFQTATV